MLPIFSISRIYNKFKYVYMYIYINICACIFFLKATTQSAIKHLPAYNSAFSNPSLNKSFSSHYLNTHAEEG